MIVCGHGNHLIDGIGGRSVIIARYSRSAICRRHHLLYLKYHRFLWFNENSTNTRLLGERR